MLIFPDCFDKLNIINRYHKKPRESFQKMKAEEVNEIMHDETFIKAVIFRDPALR